MSLKEEFEHWPVLIDFPPRKLKGHTNITKWAVDMNPYALHRRESNFNSEAFRDHVRRLTVAMHDDMNENPDDYKVAK
jgi:hypothetical protein